MPPEQAIDSKYSGPEVDIYGMGGVLYYCLSGRIMYDISPSAHPSELLTAVLSRKILPLQQSCAGLQEVVDRAVGRDNVRRYRSARQMIALSKTRWPPTARTGARPCGITDEPFLTNTR